MKTLLYSAIAGAAVLATLPASAELIIYKGTARINYIGQSHNLQVNFKLFLIVDHNTANVGEIFYTSAGGQKAYSTDTETNLHVVQVSGSGGKVYTAISQPPDDCETNSTSEGVYLEGVTVTLKVFTNNSIYFPKTVTSKESAYDSADPANLSDGTLVGNFDQKNTQISNSGGEDLDAALARLVLYVQSQGYLEETLKSARKNDGPLAHAARLAATLGPLP